MDNKGNSRKKKTRHIIRFTSEDGKEYSGIVMNRLREGYFVLLLPKKRAIWAVPHKYVIRDQDNKTDSKEGENNEHE